MLAPETPRPPKRSSERPKRPKHVLPRQRMPRSFSRQQLNPSPVSVLKSGVVEGMAYTLYTDGSIEAKLPEGTVRFASWPSFARISRAIPEPAQRDLPSVAAASKLSATPFMQ